jgi:hypothetical protein
MRTIAVYFSAQDGSSPPSGNPAYVEAYELLSRIITRKGGRMIVVRGRESCLGAGRFSAGWELKGDVWQRFDEEIVADLVFVKDRDFPVDGASKRVNSLEFEDLCSNKDETYVAFPEVFPKTVLVGEEAELEAALAQIDGETIVAKPADGACGRGVYVGPRPGLDLAALPYPLLVQECIDMSQGVPGLCTALHDLRIVLVGGTLALCTLRTPKEGSLIANAAQGGSLILVPQPKIPPQALALALSIDRRLQQFPERVYSVDMALHRGTDWKVIELNAPPGLTPPKYGEGVTAYYEMLADHLLRHA